MNPTKITETKDQEFTSDLLRKTTLLTIPKHQESFIVTKEHIDELFKPVYERESTRGKILPHINCIDIPDKMGESMLRNYFNGKVFAGFANDFTTTVYRAKSHIILPTFFEEVEIKQIKKLYDYLKALSIIREGILAGEVDKLGKHLRAHFDVEGEKGSFHVCAYRFGYANLDLEVTVSKSVMMNVMNPGSGVCL